MRYVRGIAFVATLFAAAAVASCSSDQHTQVASLGWAPVGARGPGSGPWRVASAEAHGLSTAKLVVREGLRRTVAPNPFAPVLLLCRPLSYGITRAWFFSLAGCRRVRERAARRT